MVLVSCKNCQKVYERENYDSFRCTRCNHKVTKRVENSFQVSFALLICATLFYIPAMFYPMMKMTQMGVSVESTILEGVTGFWQMNDYFIAIVIFVASIAIPLVKIVGLFFIFISLKINVKMGNKTKIWIFKFIEVIGKWSMIDIYVVAILSSTIHAGEIMDVKSGIAATSFALMVILTMMSANKFDTRIIWDETR